MLVFCFGFLFFILSILYFSIFCIVLCTVAPFVLSLSYFCTSLPTTSTGWKPNCSKQITCIIYHYAQVSDSNVLLKLPFALSSVGIATDYGLDGPGSNPSGDEIFRPSRPALGPNQTPVQYNGYRVFPGGRGGQGVELTPHPHLECRGPRKSTAIPLFTLRAFVAYKKGETYLPFALSSKPDVSGQDWGSGPNE